MREVMHTVWDGVKLAGRRVSVAALGMTTEDIAALEDGWRGSRSKSLDNPECLYSNARLTHSITVNELADYIASVKNSREGFHAQFKVRLKID